jgi:hypothetical protein
MRLGMPRDEVRGVMQAPYRLVMKTPDSTEPYDYFFQHGIHVYYDAAGHCEFVEMGTPARPELFSRPLLHEPFHRFYDWLRGRASRIRLSRSGLLCFDYCIGVYVPGLKTSASSPIESVSLFRPGYWDKSKGTRAEANTEAQAGHAQQGAGEKGHGDSSDK